jgi:hypothetical protein
MGEMRPKAEISTLDDTIRMDVADHDKDYVHEVLDTLRARAASYGRTLVEIRMSKMMFDRWQLNGKQWGLSSRGFRLERAPDGFANLHDIASHAELEAIVKGYAKMAGFDQAQVNR